MHRRRAGNSCALGICSVFDLYLALLLITKRGLQTAQVHAPGKVTCPASVCSFQCLSGRYVTKFSAHITAILKSEEILVLNLQYSSDGSGNC